jgi:hypothetical protein
MALLTARSDRSRELNWIQIGAMAGPTMYLAQLPSLVDQIKAGAIALIPRPKPLADVESNWAGTDEPGERTVLVP